MAKDTKTDNDGKGEIQAKKHGRGDITPIAPWMWKKGQSGNPAGRPKGKTLKERARELFMTMSDEEFSVFLEGLPKLDVWKMAEGNPESKTDLTTKGESLNIVSPDDLRAAALLNDLEKNEIHSGENITAEGVNTDVVGFKTQDKE